MKSDCDAVCEKTFLMVTFLINLKMRKEGRIRGGVGGYRINIVSDITTV